MIVVIIITAVSNGANMTDGLDGLTGTRQLLVSHWHYLHMCLVI